jgi:hypothetical protein
MLYSHIPLEMANHISGPKASYAYTLSQFDDLLKPRHISWFTTFIFPCIRKQPTLRVCSDGSVSVFVHAVRLSIDNCSMKRTYSSRISASDGHG